MHETIITITVTRDAGGYDIIATRPGCTPRPARICTTDPIGELVDEVAAAARDVAQIELEIATAPPPAVQVLSVTRWQRRASVCTRLPLDEALVDFNARHPPTYAQPWRLAKAAAFETGERNGHACSCKNAPESQFHYLLEC